MSITILAPGLLTTVQDTGRDRHAALGVGHAGAMDSVALRLGNILVGNVDNAAALEITLRGPRLRFGNDHVIAITGADIQAQCNGEPVLPWRHVLLRAGSELAFGGVACGMRSYLAVAGGIDIAPVLGSRSTDINSGLGGRVLATGDVLAIATARQIHGRNVRPGAAAWSLDPRPWFDADLRAPLRATVASHFQQLDAASRHALFATAFRIDADSNRVGYRLRGARLELREPLELVSEGLAAGTLQLPPDGNPIVLMAEAPTCGGYPRIAHVIAVDIPRLAQRRPGATLRLVETSLADAQTRYLERERVLARITQTVNERLYGPH